MPTVAHSVIDTREHAALAVIRAVRDGVAEQLSATADELDALPARPAIRAAVSAIAVATAVEAAVPTVSHPRQ
jgi:hypothetical protein